MNEKKEMSLLLQNQLILGDCLEKMKDIPDHTIDMILTDLPYGVTNRNKWDSVIDFKELWVQWNRIKKETTPTILTAIQPFTSFTVMSNPNNFKYEWIWEKPKGTGFLNAKKQPLRNHESILIFYNKQCCYNPQFVKGEPYIRNNQNQSTSNYGEYNAKRLVIKDGMRYPKTVIKYSNGRVQEHPTEKPVELFEYLIKTYTNENNLVLDCCAGSGTTAIACINTKRNYICIEKDENYFNIMKERVSKHTVQEVLIPHNTSNELSK